MATKIEKANRNEESLILPESRCFQQHRIIKTQPMLELNLQPVPYLETERLLLREINETDLNEIFLLRSDPVVMKYIDRPIAESAEDAKDLLAKINEAANNNTGITWGIQLKEKTELIGTIGFWRIDKDNHRGEIGYMLSPHFFRMGIASEAITAANNYAFKTLNFHSIEAKCKYRECSFHAPVGENGFQKGSTFPGKLLLQRQIFRFYNLCAVGE